MKSLNNDRRISAGAYLVGLLRAKQGLSRRQAVAVVNAILETMIAALRRGKWVKFPFGYLHRERRHFSEYWDMLERLARFRRGAAP